MIFTWEKDGCVRVDHYRVLLNDDVTIGYLRKGGEDEDYWHFYPSDKCVLNAGACNRIAAKLAELNGGE